MIRHTLLRPKEREFSESSSNGDKLWLLTYWNASKGLTSYTLHTTVGVQSSSSMIDENANGANLYPSPS